MSRKTRTSRALEGWSGKGSSLSTGASGTGWSSSSDIWFDVGPSLLFIIVWKTGCPSSPVRVGGIAHLP